MNQNYRGNKKNLKTTQYSDNIHVMYKNIFRCVRRYLFDYLKHREANKIAKKGATALYQQQIERLYTDLKSKISSDTLPR